MMEARIVGTRGVPGRTRAVPLLALALLVLCAAVGSAQKPPDVKMFPVLAFEGKNAPDFKVDFAVNGEKATLADLAGKVVLLDFWGVFAKSSRSALPDLVKLHEAHHGKGLVIIGLTRLYKKYDFQGGKLVNARKPLTAAEEQAMLAAFARSRKLPYRIQVSPDAVFNYKISSIPMAVLIDKKGVVRMVKVSYSPANVKALDAKIKELAEE